MRRILGAVLAVSLAIGVTGVPAAAKPNLPGCIGQLTSAAANEHGGLAQHPIAQEQGMKALRQAIRLSCATINDPTLADAPSANDPGLPINDPGFVYDPGAGANDPGANDPGI